ncbi:MAG: hypothetical protein H6Q89_4483 [Myxococcaceae bacterium]|nr:hypothetical protein [Myxococcaceae bacterium]
MPLRKLVQRLAVPLALAWALTGCVTIYQPLVTLQRPAVINPEYNNFDGLQLLLRCLPTDYTDSGDSEILCQNLRTLFTNQGATVQVEVPEAELPPAEEGTARPDLVIELTSKQLHSENSALLWVLCYASLTLIPAVTEATFAQDVVLRDADGFLLGSESLQGRFVRYFGLGYWGINALMDLIVRPKEEKLTGAAAKTDFSRDFYGQLSQLAFHARMRQLVLRGFEAPIAASPKPTLNPAALPGLAPSPTEFTNPFAAPGRAPK